MDFAVVQAPSVNEGYSTFCTGLDRTGHLLFIYGAGSKVMVFNGHFQLVQIIRCSTGAGYIRAVVFNPIDEMIVLGYGKQIELYEAYRAHPNGHGSRSDGEEQSEADEEDDDGECHHHEWRRAVSFAVPFEVSSLAWSARGVLAVGGDAGIALFEPQQMQESLTSLLHPVSTAWIPSRVQSLPAGSRIDRMAFSPGGCFLVAADSRDRSSGRLRVWSFDTSCFGESHVLSHLSHVLGPPYKAKLDQLRAAASANSGQFVVLDHGKGVAIAGFSWWPSRKMGAGALLLTWSGSGLFFIWLPQPVPEGFTFHLCHSFEARLAYWLPPAEEDSHVASLAVLDNDGQSFCLRLYNFDRWKEWLIRVEMDPADFAYGFELDAFGPADLPWIADPHFLVIARPTNQLVQVFERIDSEADGNVFWETFSWNVAAKPSFPLQMVSPYRAIGASVFHGTPALLDVCTLAESGACEILDCAKLGPFDAEIVALQWVPDGHAFVTTATTSCYAVVFDASGLGEERSVKIFSLPGEQVVFVGAVSGRDWATFYEKGSKRIMAYQLDFEAGLVVGEPKVLATFENDTGHPGFIQTLDLDPSHHDDASSNDSFILYSSSDNRQWHLHRNGKRELVYTHTEQVLLARTSIYGDIALVSPIPDQPAVHAITVATPSREGPVLVAELDRVLAIKWVVFDAKQQVRHLLVCTVSGIVILVASFQVDACGFNESWHVLDLCSFPAFLSPPLPPFYAHSADGLDYDHAQHSTANVASTASISCIAKSLVIWLSVDDMIAMFAPLLESPMWDAVGNALVPAPECETWCRFYTFVYSVMTRGTVDTAGVVEDLVKNPDGRSNHHSPSNSTRAKGDYGELFADLSFGDSSTESDNSEHADDDEDLRPAHSDSTSSNSSIARAKGLIQRLAHGLDDPGLKYMALNFLDEAPFALDLEGFPLLCAYLSDAQDLLVSEALSMIDNNLSWTQFRRLGFVAWLKSEAVLHRLVEQMARHEVADGDHRKIEEVSPFYLLLGKPRALQALWKTSSSSSQQMAAFLGRDFTQPENRLAASKNGFAALGKQKHHLATAFFLLAGAVGDALQVAVERLRDWPLAVLIARMSGPEAAVLFHERHLGRVELGGVQGLLGSLLLGKGDLMGQVRRCLSHRPDLLLALSQLSRYHADDPIDDEVVLHAARRMLSLGALDPAVRCLEQFGSSHLAFDLLTARMVLKRWQHACLQSSHDQPEMV